MPALARQTRVFQLFAAVLILIGLALAQIWISVLATLTLILLIAVSDGAVRQKALANLPVQRQSDLADTNKVLDAVAIPIILLDRRGLVTRANTAAREAFPGCRTGVPLSGAIRAPNVLQSVEDVLGGGAATAVELVDRVPVERIFLMQVSPVPSSGRPGEESAIIHAIETTEARRIEAMRVDFVANASHELRTPLASILGFVETLEGPAREDASARQRFLSIIRVQAQRMARLVEDLLSLSRIEMKAHIAPTETIDLRLLLPQLVDSLSGIARERGVAIAIEIEPGISTTITGDRDELLRLFENLIENGIKYGQSGRKVDVRLSAMPERRELRVAVRDYGPGIAPEHLPRLTERFYRADVQESRIQGGTGLGLALVKHIATRHRGRLLIESVQGEGATFTVVLPTA